MIHDQSKPDAFCCMKAEKMSVRIGSANILESVNLHVHCGELLAVIGPNGAGKTTLLRALLGEIPYLGRVDYRVNGEPRRHCRMGYVPQRIHFDKDSPVCVHDMMAAAVSRRPVWLSLSRKIESMVREVLDKVAAGHLIHRRLSELSGGELQRVLLAMAVTPVPQLLLLDEPVSAVDAAGLHLFYDLASEYRKKHDTSIIMVTHDITGIAPYADRMVLLNGRVVADGKPRDILADKKIFETFGPGLWNVSRFPCLENPDKGK